MAFWLVATMVAGLAQDPGARSPAPGDDEMLAALAEAAPGAEVLSVAHGAPSPAAAPEMRRSCGTLRIGGRVEPFAVLALWQDPRNRIVVKAGPESAITHPPVEWKIIATVAARSHAAGDGIATRLDRNWDAVQRRTVLAFCRDLTPPEGTMWVTEFEPAP